MAKRILSVKNERSCLLSRECDNRRQLVSRRLIYYHESLPPNCFFPNNLVHWPSIPRGKRISIPCNHFHAVFTIADQHDNLKRVSVSAATDNELMLQVGEGDVAKLGVLFERHHRLQLLRRTKSTPCAAGGFPRGLRFPNAFFGYFLWHQKK